MKIDSEGKMKINKDTYLNAKSAEMKFIGILVSNLFIANVGLWE